MQTRKKLPLTLVSEHVQPAEVVPIFRERRKLDRRQSANAATDGDAKKFRAVFECVSEAIISIDDHGRIELVNAAAEEMTGYLRNELAGKPLVSIAPKGKTPGRTRPLAQDIFASEGTYEDISIETKDGLPRVVDVSVRIMVGAEAAAGFSVVVFRDVTEKKRMEREVITKHGELRNAFIEVERTNAELKAAQETLVQAGKMAALGELAAGIAHELNQPLMSIRGYAQELQYGLEPYVKGTPAEGEASLGLKEIISAADKMAKIISHLRTFTRKSTEDLEWVDVRNPVEEALKMVSRQLTSRGVKVVREYPSIAETGAGTPAPIVYGNPLSLEQVFINLTTNARDAIEATGRGDGTITISAQVDGPFVEVKFRDDGVGMATVTKAKAFNPFFTTKEVGKGMGLGLSLSYGILSKVHGSIRIESEEGKGTTFVIRIPKDFRQLG